MVCVVVGAAVPAQAATGPQQASRVAAVVNDDFDNALIVSAIPYSDAQDVITATTAADDPALPCAYDQQKYNTVWYRYTPSTGDTMVFNKWGSSYSAVLAVWTGTRGSLTNQACSTEAQVELAVIEGTTYYIEIARFADSIYPEPTSLNLVFSVWSASTPPAAFNKLAPANGSAYESTVPSLSWSESDYAANYAYCYDTSDNDVCDTSWVTTAGLSAKLSGLSMGTMYYWQVRAENSAEVAYADGGPWWSFTTASADDLNHWAGTVSGTTRAMAFDVLTDGTQWLYFSVVIPYSGCNASGTATVRVGGPGAISENHFSYTSDTFRTSGTFPTRTTATGTYTLVNYPVCVWTSPGYCCYALTSGSGIWTASGPPLTPTRRVYLPLVLGNPLP